MNRQDALEALKLPLSAGDSEIQARLRRKEKSLRSGLNNALNQEMKETYQRRLSRLQEIRRCLEDQESSVKALGRADSDVDALALMLSMTHNPGHREDPIRIEASEEPGEDPVDVDDAWLDPDDDPQTLADALTETTATKISPQDADEEEERTKTTDASVETYNAFYDLDLDDLDPDLTPTEVEITPDEPPAEEIILGPRSESELLVSPEQPDSTAPEEFIAVSEVPDAFAIVEEAAGRPNNEDADEIELDPPSLDAAPETSSEDEALTTKPVKTSSETALLGYPPEEHDLSDPNARFEILEKVPSSPTYQHFKARDRLRNETVLLKTLAENLAQDGASQKTFLQTALAISRISHPNLIKVFDIHRFSGQVYVSMEWLEPYSLRDEIETRKRNGHCFESYELMRIGRELRDLLATLQILVPHCGMKPENIHYQESGALKLIDIDPFDHRSSYAAQELQQSDANDSAADQFSMAVLLSELAAVPSEKIGYHERAGKDMPGGFFTAVQRAQSKDPERRFPDLDSFVAALSSRGETKPSWRRPVLQLALLLFVFVLGIFSASQQSRIQNLYTQWAAKDTPKDANEKSLREVKTLGSGEIPRVEQDRRVTTPPKKAQCSLCQSSASCVTCRGQGKLIDSCKKCKGLSQISRDCQDCDPKGQKSCSSCSGTGTLTPKCIQCDGEKTLECEECLGKKTLKKVCVDCKGRKSGPCQVCKSLGTIKEICKDCLGKKEMPCVQCKGAIDYTIPCDYVLSYMGKSSPCVKGEVICPECTGSGKLGAKNCDLCLGSGRQECVNFCLKGRLKRRCTACQKTGRQPCTNKRCRLRGTWTIECTNCLGLKKADCQSCQASGQQLVACHECQSKGRRPCTSCKGQGRLQRICPSCKGKGRANCYLCLGKKVIHENCDQCENGRNAKDCLHCKGSGRCPESQ